MIIGQFTNPTVTFPTAIDGAKAAVAYYNSHGGVNGHMLQLEVCDDTGDPNVGASCARQAISDGVVATVGDASFEGATVLPILQSAHIAAIGNDAIDPIDSTSPASFPVDGGTIVGYGGASYALARSGECTKIGIVGADVPEVTGQITTAVVNAAKFNNITAGAEIYYPEAGGDMDPVAAKVEASGTNCFVFAGVGADGYVLFTDSAQAGGKIHFGITPAGEQPSDLQKLGTVGNGLKLVDTFAPVGGDNPAIVTIKAALNQVNPKDAIDTYVLRSWAGVEIAVDMAKKITGTVTADGVWDQLNAATNINLGFVAPLNFAKQSPLSGANRIFNTSVLLETVQDGVAVPDSNTFVNLASALSS